MTQEEFDGLSESSKEDFEPSPPTGIVDRDFTAQGGMTMLADPTDTLEDGINYSTRCDRCQCRTPRERWRTASGHLICRYCAGLAQRPDRKFPGAGDAAPDRTLRSQIRDRERMD